MTPGKMVFRMVRGIGAVTLAIALWDFSWQAVLGVILMWLGQMVQEDLGK